MNKYQAISRFLSVTAGLCLAVNAYAQPDPMAAKCRLGAICVYDANGKIVGVETSNQSINVVQRFLGSAWYQLNFSTNLGFDTNALLQYTQAGCAGQPYMTTGYLIGPADLIHPNEIRLVSPPGAGFDGRATIWGPVGQSSVINFTSFSYEDQCYAGAWGANPTPAAPAVKLEVRALPTPRTIR